MKFLEAQKQDGKEQKASIQTENKMKPGTRLDQKDPEALVSSPRRSPTTGANKDEGITKLAKELNVDLSTVTGSGPGGQITEKDVRNAKK